MGVYVQFLACISVVGIGPMACRLCSTYWVAEAESYLTLISRPKDSCNSCDLQRGKLLCFFPLEKCAAFLREQCWVFPVLAEGVELFCLMSRIEQAGFLVTV